jgi:adenylosuccinate synthase
MAGTCVVGLQWGDEAKGKIVDRLAERADYVVRYNGGANAGHTIVWGERKFKLSLLPSGILRSTLTSVIGNGVVVFPPRLFEELQQLADAGLEPTQNLKISDRAHVIFPYHQEEERANDQGSAIGTTGRGIGPCYQDKLGRINGIRLGDLLAPQRLRTKLETIVPRKNRLLAAISAGAARQFDAGALVDEYARYGERIRPFVTDTVPLLQQAALADQTIIYEAAQGSLLDVDFGTYPFVTSSHSSPAGIWSGTGVPGKHLHRVIGIMKAYTTRVGQGPLPTELDNEIGQRIRIAGHEFGTVTGRPRRVGWFDAVAVRTTAALAGADELALMLLDVLSCVDEIHVCTAYHHHGAKLTQLPSDPDVLAQCRPHYHVLPGWGSDITGIRKLADLPSAARAYVDFVQTLIGVPIRTVSVGPERTQTIEVE